MNESNRTTMWVVGILAILVLVGGLWWFMSDAANPMDSGPNATSTPTGATSTPQAGSQTGGSRAVQETRTSSSVASIVASLGNASRFASLYAASGVSLSSAGGPYTVFVPADSAFGNLTPATISSMTAAEKKRLVQNHIVAGKMLDMDAVNSGTHTTLSKDMLNFNVNAQTKVAYVGSGYAITQYKASNGVVYVITAVLVPPQETGTNGNTGSITP